MKTILTFLSILLGTAVSSAQHFEKLDSSSSPFTATAHGSVDLIDVDGDGDLDVFITGDPGNENQAISELYIKKNDGSYERDDTTPFPGLENAAVTFADIESDKDLDVILTGKKEDGTRLTALYLNNGSGTFSKDSNQPFNQVSHASMAIVDIDGDGDLDFIVSGYNTEANGRISEVYKNDGSNPAVFTLFTENAAFEAIDEGAIKVADIDDDGDQDLLVTGDTGGTNGETTKLYLNDGAGVFALDTTNSDLLLNLRASSADFADVDGDGDPDLLINGRYGSSDRAARLYLNNGGVFSSVQNTPFVGGNAGTVDFFDADNDSDQDVLITGYGTGDPNRTTHLYTNDGEGGFTKETKETFSGVNNSDVAIADLDNDNFQDLIIMGYASSRTVETYLNTNEESTASVPPSDANAERFYPNPTSGTIVFPGGEVEEIRIFNVTGKKLTSLKVLDDQADLSGLQKGIYFIKTNKSTFKVVKK